MYVYILLLAKQLEPKSITLRPDFVNSFKSMFSGFRSQCMILHAFR